MRCRCAARVLLLMLGGASLRSVWADGGHQWASRTRPLVAQTCWPARPRAHLPLPILQLLAQCHRTFCNYLSLAPCPLPGLSLLNISLDTLRPERFEAMTRRRGHDRVLRAIDTALQLG